MLGFLFVDYESFSPSVVYFLILTRPQISVVIYIPPFCKLALVFINSLRLLHSHPGVAKSLHFVLTVTAFSYQSWAFSKKPTYSWSAVLARMSTKRNQLFRFKWERCLCWTNAISVALEILTKADESTASSGQYPHFPQALHQIVQRLTVSTISSVISGGHNSLMKNEIDFSLNRRVGSGHATNSGGFVTSIKQR
jgi:hypothetical protein